MAKLWTAWLTERYGSSERWAKAWGRDAVESLDKVSLPPLNSAAWDNVAAVDRARFEIWLTRRWNEAHVQAVRQHDDRHPIMSEYYQRPQGGLDLPLTIDGQDVADIGYFDAPVADIDKLPLAIRFNDLRARGKGVTLGEYGVKTHPAWEVENGATHYHIRRSEEEQKQLFLAVGHYALGLGAAKVQNWCLNDAQSHVFPWGMFYPQQHMPKDVAYVHRNQSVIWRMFAPRYEASPLTSVPARQSPSGQSPAIGHRRTVPGDRRSAGRAFRFQRHQRSSFGGVAGDDTRLALSVPVRHRGRRLPAASPLGPGGRYADRDRRHFVRRRSATNSPSATARTAGCGVRGGAVSERGAASRTGLRRLVPTSGIAADVVKTVSRSATAGRRGSGHHDRRDARPHPASARDRGPSTGWPIRWNWMARMSRLPRGKPFMPLCWKRRASGPWA